MLYMPKIADNPKIMTDEEVKDFVMINFGEYWKSAREAFILNQAKEKIFKKLLNSFMFLTTPDEVKRYVELIEKSK